MARPDRTAGRFIVGLKILGKGAIYWRNRSPMAVGKAGLRIFFVPAEIVSEKQNFTAPLP